MTPGHYPDLDAIHVVTVRPRGEGNIGLHIEDCVMDGLD